MKKSLISLFALAFALMFGMVHVASAAPAGADKAVTKACKGKKAGEVVTVDGKEVNCPEKKKMKKKHTKNEMKQEQKEAAPAAPAPAK